MKMCNCEDFPCCNCGQEYMAEMRYEASGGYADFRDPYDDDREYWAMVEAEMDEWEDEDE